MYKESFKNHNFSYTWHACDDSSDFTRDMLKRNTKHARIVQN